MRRLAQGAKFSSVTDQISQDARAPFRSSEKWRTAAAEWRRPEMRQNLVQRKGRVNKKMRAHALPISPQRQTLEESLPWRGIVITDRRPTTGCNVQIRDYSDIRKALPARCPAAAGVARAPRPRAFTTHPRNGTSSRTGGGKSDLGRRIQVFPACGWTTIRQLRQVVKLIVRRD
jgi:hypothetical protein